MKREVLKFHFQHRFGHCYTNTFEVCAPRYVRFFFIDRDKIPFAKCIYSQRIMSFWVEKEVENYLSLNIAETFTYIPWEHTEVTLDNALSNATSINNIFINPY